jgi:hypothetical protein
MNLSSTEKEQHHASHHGGDLQAVDAVLRGDACEDDDEGAGRPGDLHTAAAERGNQEARDNRGVEALLRLGARRDGKGHRQRQRDDADDHPGDDIGKPVRPREQAGYAGF